MGGWGAGLLVPFKEILFCLLVKVYLKLVDIKHN